MFDFDDDVQERQVLCERCRKFVRIANIKYLPKGNDSRMALCQSCLKTFNVQGTQIKKTLTSASHQPASYFCGRCNYKFKYNAAKDSTLRCPYCGRTDKISEEKSRSTSKLLEEADDF
jgi:protein-arginine kinase activator protein McsA